MSQNNNDEQLDQAFAPLISELRSLPMPQMPSPARNQLKARLLAQHGAAKQPRYRWNMPVLFSARPMRLALALLLIAGMMLATPLAHALGELFKNEVVVSELPPELQAVRDGTSTQTPIPVHTSYAPASIGQLQQELAYPLLLPTYLPAGLEFGEASRTESPMYGVGADITYRGGTQHLTVSQSQPPYPNRTIVPPEQVAHQELINGHLAVLYHPQRLTPSGPVAHTEQLILEWTDGTRVVTLFSNLSAEELVMVLQGLQ